MIPEDGTKLSYACPKGLLNLKVNVRILYCLVYMLSLSPIIVNDDDNNHDKNYIVFCTNYTDN